MFLSAQDISARQALDLLYLKDNLLPVALACVLWCASVLFLLLGRMLFSPVIRMPASSSATFRAFTSLRANTVRSKNVLL